MLIKQVKNILQKLSVFALILLAFTCFINIKKGASSYSFEQKHSERSFEHEGQHHSKLLLVQTPVFHFHLKEQTYKRFFEGFIRVIRMEAFAAIPKTVKIYQGVIRHLFFQKHLSLLYPFHSLW